MDVTEGSCTSLSSCFAVSDRSRRATPAQADESRTLHLSRLWFSCAPTLSARAPSVYAIYRPACALQRQQQHIKLRHAPPGSQSHTSKFVLATRAPVSSAATAHRNIGYGQSSSSEASSIISIALASPAAESRASSLPPTAVTFPSSFTALPILFDSCCSG